MTFPAKGEFFISFTGSGKEIEVGRALDAHLCTDFKGYWRPFEGTEWFPCNVSNSPQFRIILDTHNNESTLIVEFEKFYIMTGTRHSCEPGIYFKVECIK